MVSKESVTFEEWIAHCFDDRYPFYHNVENIDDRIATGAPVAMVSQANSGMIRRDVLRMADDVRRFSAFATPAGEGVY